MTTAHACDPPTVVLYLTNARTPSRSRQVPDSPEGALWRCPDCRSIHRSIGYSWASRTTLRDRVAAWWRGL